MIVIQHADMQVLDYGAAYSLLQICCIIQAFQSRGLEQEQETGNPLDILQHGWLWVLVQALLGSGASCENLKTMSHICLPVLTSGKKDSNWCLQEKKLNKEISSLWISTYKFPHSESLLGIPSAFHREQFLHS